MHFWLKANLKLITMLNSIKTLKRNYKATLNVLKKIFDYDKIFVYKINFLCQIKTFLLDM